MGDEFFNGFDVNRLVHDIDVVLTEQVQMLGRRICSHDARRNVVVELFAQLLDEINSILRPQAKVTQNEIEFGQNC